MKVLASTRVDGSVAYLFECPGCGYNHGPQVGSPSGPNWTFNGDLNKPTFTPSILMRTSGESGDVVCHSFVTEGFIKFLNDCTHKLAGQTVELPDQE